MKTILSILALSMVLAASAQATVSSFTCRTDRALKDNHKYTLQFQLEGLGTRHVRAIPQSSEANEIFVTVSPRNEELMVLNDNFALNVNSSAIEIRGDGDGFELLYLHLYSSRHFTRGYLRIDDTGENTRYGDQYTTVTCEVN